MLGIYDMHGNVWELCQDFLFGGSYRVYRGGSWSNSAGFCQASYRAGNDVSRSRNFVGLHLVRVPVGQILNLTLAPIVHFFPACRTISFSFPRMNR
jgi:hypothetical protein